MFLDAADKNRKYKDYTKLQADHSEMSRKFDILRNELIKVRNADKGLSKSGRPLKDSIVKTKKGKVKTPKAEDTSEKSGEDIVAELLDF